MHINELTKDQFQDPRYNHGLTVGKLKKYLADHDLPDDALVLIQRVEDRYYETHGWGVYLKEGEYARDREGNIIKENLQQYHPAWCCLQYEDDKDLLFIDLHY